jgi:hypothetical protein
MFYGWNQANRAVSPEDTAQKAPKDNEQQPDWPIHFSYLKSRRMIHACPMTAEKSPSRSKPLGTYTPLMPGGTRFSYPRSPVTVVAVVALLLILVWVTLHVFGWLR